MSVFLDYVLSYPSAPMSDLQPLAINDLHLRTLLDASPMGMLVVNHREEIILTNPLAEQLFGILPQDGPASRCGDLFRCANRLVTSQGCGHAEACPHCPISRGLRSALASTAMPSDLEGNAQLERESGCAPLWIRFNIRPLAIDGKRGALLTLADITAQRLSEERYTTLFREMLNAFALHEIICNDLGQPIDYRFLAVNPAFEQMTELVASQIIGRTVLTVLPHTEPFWIETYGRVALTGKPARFEHFSREIGKYFSIHAFCPAPGQFACLFEDITPRKILIEQSRDGIVILDYQGKIIEANQRFAEMLGYTPEEVQHLHVWDWDARWTREQLLEAIAHIDASGDFFETIYRRKDGTIIPVEISSNGSMWAGEKRVFCICRDITERKEMEEERHRLQTKLIHAQKMEAIGTLAGGIAHDFNNILGAVLGYAEMAREDSPPGSTLARDLDRVLEAGNRAASLVKQILAFSRQQEIEPITLDPGLIVEEAVKLLHPSLPATIALKYRIANRRTVLADPAQLHRVVMNLATNAFHAMEQTGGGLEIRVEDADYREADPALPQDVAPGAFVRLVVADSGSGIPAAIRNRIFDPFFTTKAIGRGTGMGLAIVDGIVRSCGGFITCESASGKGTVFTIALPAHAGEITGTSPATAAPAVGHGHLLFVDDEEMLTEMGQTMLERLGYQVTTSDSSLEALATFQSNPHRFDAVITDQTMPDMTGLDLAQRMLQIRPDLPIILCTGYSNLIDETRARALGIKGVAMKPLTKIETAALLNEVMVNRK